MTEYELHSRFAEIICHGLTQEELEAFEAMADALFDGRGCE